MIDPAHAKTDELIAEMTKKAQSVYAQARDEVQEKLDKYLKRFATNDAIKRQQMAQGVITRQEYARWRTGQIMMGKRWADMKDTLAQDYHNANEIAKSIVRGYMPEVYAINHNFAVYEAEKGSMIDTSYTLYDRQSVERLMRDNPELLPPPGKRVSQRIAEGKETRWNRQQIQSVMTQSILQGESIPQIAKRLATEVSDSNYKAAVRNARTMTTGVENAGRVDGFRYAQDMGISLSQMWVATLDDRTRNSHRHMDGEVVAVGEEFSNGLLYPGDPMGRPAEVYNCRCRLIAQISGHERDLTDLSGRYSEKLGGMSYEDWLNEHEE